jgi:hypothetical protein
LAFELFLFVYLKGVKEFYDKVQAFVDVELARYSGFLKMEVFRLQHLSPELPFYVKEIFTDLDCLQTFKVAFKGINANEFPLCFKNYYKQDVHQYDSMFCKEKLEFDK